MQSSGQHSPSLAAVLEAVVSTHISSWWHCCFNQSLPQTPDCPAAYDKLVQILSGSWAGGPAPTHHGGKMGREAAVLRQPLSPKGRFVSMPQEDNLVSSGPSYHTQVCKNQATATSRVMEIKVGEHIAGPWLISPTLPAPWSFRWCSVVWTLITDEGYFLSHESRNPPEGRLPEQAVIHPALGGGTGRGTHLIRDHRLCAVPCPRPRSRQGGELSFSY